MAAMQIHNADQCGHELLDDILANWNIQLDEIDLVIPHNLLSDVDIKGWPVPLLRALLELSQLTPNDTTKARKMLETFSLERTRKVKGTDIVIDIGDVRRAIDSLKTIAKGKATLEQSSSFSSSSPETGGIRLKVPIPELSNEGRRRSPRITKRKAQYTPETESPTKTRRAHRNTYFAAPSDNKSASGAEQSDHGVSGHPTSDVFHSSSPISPPLGNMKMLPFGITDGHFPLDPLSDSLVSYGGSSSCSPSLGAQHCTPMPHRTPNHNSPVAPSNTPALDCALARSTFLASTSPPSQHSSSIGRKLRISSITNSANLSPPRSARLLPAPVGSSSTEILDPLMAALQADQAEVEALREARQESDARWAVLDNVGDSELQILRLDLVVAEKELQIARLKVEIRKHELRLAK